MEAKCFDTLVLIEYKFYNMNMDAVEKLRKLETYTQVEVESVPASPAAKTSCPVNPIKELPIQMAALPNGKRIPLLKTVLTAVCENNCTYCAFRKDRDFQRETFRPDELADAVIRLWRAQVIEGLFLSSGVAGGGVRTQDRLIDTAEILRNRRGFTGYLHLKIMPGAEYAQVLRCMQLADRVSVNLEAPNQNRLDLLAPDKQFLPQLLQPLKWVDEIRRNVVPTQVWKGRWPSSTTQFVVGAVGESDLELLETAAHLHRDTHLSRVYFSGFGPVRDTPLENQPPLDPWREHRLYQADFLLRDYGFDLEDLPFQKGGELPLDVDPKLAWARDHLSQAPVEINRAELQELMRVPGIGPKGALAIVAARRQERLRFLGDLQRLGIAADRAAAFVAFNGRRAAFQLRLF